MGRWKETSLIQHTGMGKQLDKHSFIGFFFYRGDSKTTADFEIYYGIPSLGRFAFEFLRGDIILIKQRVLPNNSHVCATAHLLMCVTAKYHYCTEKSQL